MNVSPNELRKQTAETFKEVESALETAKRAGARLETATLLLAKAQCLQTLTLLNEQGKKR